MIETIGWLGALIFACSGVPQTYRSWKDKHSDGLSWGFLAMWFVGEVLTIGYMTAIDGPLPLLVNYWFNFATLLVILYYKINPGRQLSPA